MTDHYTAGVAALVHASTAALRFYDNLDRLHDKGEPEVLDALQRAVDQVRALSPAPAQGWRDIERDALRYRWLRSRDVDTIGNGGVFAGKTPENLVLNGDDLDRYIDEAIVEHAMIPPAPQRGEGGE